MVNYLRGTADDITLKDQLGNAVEYNKRNC